VTGVKVKETYVRLEGFTAVTMKIAILGYKHPVRTSQETYYVSATEPSWLTLHRI
jgi:hypothetical protein